MYKIVNQEEFLINSYIIKCLESERTIISTQIMRRILDDKYEKSDIKKFITKQCK